MKNWLIKNKSQILKVLLLIGIIALIGVGAYLILRGCGFTTKEDFIQLRDNLGENIWFWVIIVALQIFQTIFIPISNQLVTGAMSIIYVDELWKVWITAGIGITIGSIILYFIGRFGGEKIIGWVLGDKEKAKKCKDLMNKGKGFYVIGMFIPFVPDDVLSTLAGVGKFNIPFVIVITTVARFTCTAFTTWCVGLLTKFWWMWLVLASGVAIMIFATIIVYKKSFGKGK